MNTKDGKIYTKEEFRDKCEAEEQKRMVEFDPADMTRKQRERSQISLHDHRSKLGKILTNKRREMGIHRKR